MRLLLYTLTWRVYGNRKSILLDGSLLLIVCGMQEFERMIADSNIVPVKEVLRHLQLPQPASSFVMDVITSYRL